jgi:DNA-directed RNA polymerase specialized sigma24 family protein
MAHETDFDYRFDPDQALDLRRKRQREMADSIISRAEYLTGPDRTLVLAVYEDNRRMSDLARMMGIHPRSLRRRVRRLIERMMSPKFAFVASRRDQWASTQRRVATACVLHGLSIRAAADQLKLSHYTVRKHCDIVQTLYAAHRQWKKL